MTSIGGDNALPDLIKASVIILSPAYNPKIKRKQRKQC